MNETLHPLRMIPLPVGSIRPQGWLLQQLRIQAGAILRSPLVYALKVGEDWRQVNADVPGRELPARQAAAGHTQRAGCSRVWRWKR